MRRFLSLGLIGAALSLGAGPALAQGKLRAEVMHWWTSGGESAAVQEFQKAFNAAGGEWVDAAVAGGGGDAARTAFMNRLAGGNPPTAMQFNTSKQFDDVIAAGQLIELDDVAQKDGWKGAVYGPVMDAVTRNGHVYAVPVNIHNNIWLWYNADVLKKAGVAPPKTWDDLFADFDKVKAAGVVPLAQAGDNWTKALTFFNVLLGEAGPPLYLKLFKDLDADATKTPEFKHVLETFGKLRNYVDNGVQGRQWNQAIGMVITGQAAFNFMGDWAKGEVVSAGQTPGNPVGCIAGLGHPAYWIGGDVFVFAKQSDPEAIKGQKLLAHVMLSKETQVAFNAKKGSVPARLDVDNSKLDVCAQQGLKILSENKDVVKGFDLYLTPDGVGQVYDAIGQFWSDPNETTDQLAGKFAEILKNAKQ
ncbi:MAG: carbohydrate ABC transporter substrate-binding protein [Methylobacteriaceae bacterium]|nr:carbohydrate ABC transporter substrate-binding protein [Methylobacteriaceae bacterium]MBV9246489.1 carbohydrate ABC transporter substrate-binding protein [Methylobacteriaceae bacterium]